MAAAVWAPSVHNTQPWRFTVRGQQISLYADAERQLRVADPDGREMMISCGAALFTARLAVRSLGYLPEICLLPDPGQPLLVARVSWQRRAACTEFASVVYASPAYIDTLATSTPISAHVPVDFELRGCPIDRRQLLEVLTALLVGRKPDIPDASVCTECKRRGLTCVMVADGTPCLGPVTHAGCGALCPAHSRGCYGCFGPMATPNVPALARQLRICGMDEGAIGRVFATFNAAAPAFADRNRDEPSH